MLEGEHVVYILVSEKKIAWSYVGCTSDLLQRIKDHNSGKTRSTKPYRPLKVIHIEYYSSKEDAYTRELFLKSGIGREEKKKIVFHSGIV